MLKFTKDQLEKLANLVNADMATTRIELANAGPDMDLLAIHLGTLIGIRAQLNTELEEVKVPSNKGRKPGTKIVDGKVVAPAPASH